MNEWKQQFAKTGGLHGKIPQGGCKVSYLPQLNILKEKTENEKTTIIVPRRSIERYMCIATSALLANAKMIFLKPYRLNSNCRSSSR